MAKLDKNITILVVDDFATMRRIVKNLLCELGFDPKKIVEAEDGNKAFTVLETNATPIQFIVSDWNMPNCSGIELLKKVRADKRFGKDMPFLMITAEAKRSQILEAAEAGVNGYIVKPFTATQLKEKIDKIFERFNH
jgi:two-component system chemotaxis response regulator CheY